MLNAGSLSKRITIQYQVTTQDAYGQQEQSWDELMSCWGSIHAVTGREVYAASGFTSQLSHKITIRYPAMSIRSNMRVVYEDRTFNIQSVSDPDEGKTQLDLLCLEINEGQ